MSRFWSFAQLSDKYKGISAIDRIPGSSGLFIGGLKALDKIALLEDAKITHILSVLEFDYCDSEEFEKYQRLLVQVEDEPTEDLIRHFRMTNRFIDSALNAEGAILVHCAMGISRSAAVLCAYLMHSQHVSAQQALGRLREIRPLCAPNDGFTEQLNVYERMLMTASPEEADSIYSNWSRERRKRAKM